MINMENQVDNKAEPKTVLEDFRNSHPIIKALYLGCGSLFLIIDFAAALIETSCKILGKSINLRERFAKHTNNLDGKTSVLYTVPSIILTLVTLIGSMLTAAASISIYASKKGILKLEDGPTKDFANWLGIKQFPTPIKEIEEYAAANINARIALCEEELTKTANTYLVSKMALLHLLHGRSYQSELQI
jgi:hypothetical protein